MKQYSPSTQGFTLIELMISLLIMTAILLGVLALFDFSNHLAKVQVQRVDLQQTLRIAQHEVGRSIRLAGRGGLPVSSSSAKLPDAGWALSITPNVAANTVIAADATDADDDDDDDGDAPKVVEGTDILTIRGVISTPVYIVEHLDPTAFVIDIPNETGTITIKKSRALGEAAQELDPLREMILSNRPEALLLVSAFDDRLFAVVEFDNATAVPGTNPSEVTLKFKFNHGTHTDAYQKLSSDGETPGVFPTALLDRTRVGTLGILEEYRYYLRDGFQMEHTPSAPGEKVQKLSRARLYPGTDVAYADRVSNLKIDIADHIVDLQFAYAFDTDGDSVIKETDDGSADDWFGNAPSDTTEAGWAKIMSDDSSTLRFLRFSMVARTAEGDRQHEGRQLARVEDRVYTSTDPINDPVQILKFPRLIIKSTVELRNL